MPDRHMRTREDDAIRRLITADYRIPSGARVGRGGLPPVPDVRRLRPGTPSRMGSEDPVVASAVNAPGAGGGRRAVREPGSRGPRQVTVSSR
jgi:hypothetical protein